MEETKQEKNKLENEDFVAETQLDQNSASSPKLDNIVKKLDEIGKDVISLRLDFNLSEKVKVEDLRRELEAFEKAKNQEGAENKKNMKKVWRNVNWLAVASLTIGSSSLSLGIWNTFFRCNN